MGCGGRWLKCRHHMVSLGHALRTNEHSISLKTSDNGEAGGHGLGLPQPYSYLARLHVIHSGDYVANINGFRYHP